MSGILLLIWLLVICWLALVVNTPFWGFVVLFVLFVGFPFVTTLGYYIYRRIQNETSDS